MSFKKFVKPLFSAIVFAGLFAACTEPGCVTIADPGLRMRFIIQYNRIATSGVRQTVTKDTLIRLISVQGIGNTSNYDVSNIQDTSTVSSVRAYLSQVHDTTGFVIKWDTAKLKTNSNINSVFTDTLIVKYQRQSYFVSEGCGFNYRFRDIEIVKQTFEKSISKQIQSVTVTNPVADEGLQPNITIRFNLRKP